MADKVIFRNPGLLSLDAITTFGVSVKETDNPIGQFGTGLKYALAVLMREKCKVVISIDRIDYVVDTTDKEIRGQHFEVVILTSAREDYDPSDPYALAYNVQYLPFTTELGKKWELWMAFRELYSNTMDESGICYGRHQGEDVEPSKEGETVIVVESDEFMQVLVKKADLFIETEPVEEVKHFELHDADEEVTGIYSKGIKIAEFDRPLLSKYNFTGPVTLTEDRTLKHQEDFTQRLVESVKESDNPDFIKRIALSGKEYFESGLNFTYETVFGPTFLKTVKGLIKKHKKDINPTILHAYENTVRKQRQPKTWSYTVKVPHAEGHTKETMRGSIETEMSRFGAKVTSDWEFPW